MAGKLCIFKLSVPIPDKGMKDGDVAGLAALNGDSGVLSIIKEGKKTYLIFAEVKLRKNDRYGNPAAFVTGKKQEKRSREKQQDHPPVVLQKRGYAPAFIFHSSAAFLPGSPIPHPDNLPAINHINGNILDCSVENLEWVTHKQNSEHGVLMGLYSMGDNNPVTKIPDQIVRQICYDFQRGKGIKYVAKKYGINKHTAASIKHGNARKHISRDFDLSKAGNDTPHDEDHHLSKINNKTTHAICRDLEAGMSVPAVARKYNTTIGIVEHIKEGNTHWHIARHYNVGNSKPDKFRTIPDEVFFEVVERLKRGETNIAIADAMSDKGISRRYVDNVRNRYIRPDDTKDIVFPTVYKGPLSEETLRKTADLIMDGYSNVEIGKKLADEGMTRQMANAIRTHRAYTDMFRDYDFPETKIKRNVGLDKKRKDEARKKRYAKMMEQIANGGNLVIKLEGVRCNKVRKK